MQVTTPHEQIFFSTIRLEVTGPSGLGTATAFLFQYEWNGKMLPVLVTNKHVLAEAKQVRFFFTLREGSQPKIGERLDVTLEDVTSAWHGHPEGTIDVAVMPIAPIVEKAHAEGKSLFLRMLPNSLVPSRDQISELDAIEEVLFVGYPSGIYDTHNLMPIARRGTTATPPQLDYGGQPVFLVDASVFPGSSGSPVLICNTGGYSTKKGFRFGTRVLLLGMIAEVAFRKEHGKIDFVSIPAANVPVVTTREMLDLGIVYKSSTIVDTVVDLLKSRDLA